MRVQGVFRKRVIEWTEKWSDFDETRNLSSLDHWAHDLLCEKKFPCAARAEIALKGVKINKNVREAHIFGPIWLKIGTYALWTMAHMTCCVRGDFRARSARKSLSRV